MHPELEAMNDLWMKLSESGDVRAQRRILYWLMEYMEWSYQKSEEGKMKEAAISYQKSKLEGTAFSGAVRNE